MLRALTPQQIEYAKELHKKGYTKKQLAILFEVGQTTIWENVYSQRRRIRNRRIYFRKYVQKPKPICIPCAKCEICLTDEFEDNLPPLNYRVGDICVVCYLREQERNYMDLLKDIV
jgi:Helix-turn-helix domain of resolvase